MRVSIPLPRRCERRTLPIELIPQHIWELHGRAILAVAAVDVEHCGELDGNCLTTGWQLVDNWLTAGRTEHCEIMSRYSAHKIQDTRWELRRFIFKCLNSQRT